MCRASSADSVPTGFVLPVIMPAANREPRFSPNDLIADFESRDVQTCSKFSREPAGVPEITHVARKETVCLRPIDAVIVRNFAGAVAVVETGFMPPLRIVFDAVRRIGDHE